MDDTALASRFTFAKAADLELDEAVAWYNSKQERLGDELAAEVKKGIREVVEHPLRWAMLDDDKRRYRLKRFPYGLVYKIGSTKILFVAVMHLKRKPGYWKGRETEFGT